MQNREGEAAASLSLLEDAAKWRLLSLLFQRPAPGWESRLEDLANEVDDPALWEAVQLAGSAGEGGYLSNLGPGGVVSGRETGHQSLRDPGWLLADLAGFYRAFHYDPQGEDPPDHITTEVGFAAFLRLKESYARRAGRMEDAQVTRDALNKFLADHLSPFVESFQDRIEAAGGLQHLVVAARALAEKIRRLQSLVQLEV